MDQTTAGAPIRNSESRTRSVTFGLDAVKQTAGEYLPKKNYKKSLAAETEKATWRVKHEENRTKLCMESKDGETCYDKTEEEKSE